MINWVYLTTGIVFAFLLVVYVVFIRNELPSESGGRWFILYALIPTILVLGSISLMYFGIRGLL